MQTTYQRDALGIKSFVCRYSVREAAAQIGISEAEVQELARGGELEAQGDGAEMYFDCGSVHDYAQELGELKERVRSLTARLAAFGMSASPAKDARRGGGRKAGCGCRSTAACDCHTH